MLFTCIQCAKFFVGGNTFPRQCCSQACRDLFEHEKRIMLCSFCHTSFKRLNGHTSQKFCGLPCFHADMRAATDKAARQRLNDFSVRAESGCLEWTGNIVKGSGYGYLRYKNADRGAHRVSYELNVGPISKGLFVCHRCDNRKCIEPTHLFLGTHADNMRDATKKGRMHLGEATAQSKLTTEGVIAIRTAYAKGGITYRELAATHGVSQGCILKVVKRRDWAHVA